MFTSVAVQAALLAFLVASVLGWLAIGVVAFSIFRAARRPSLLSPGSSSSSHDELADQVAAADALQGYRELAEGRVAPSSARPCRSCGNVGTHLEGGTEHCSTCGAVQLSVASR